MTGDTSTSRDEQPSSPVKSDPAQQPEEPNSSPAPSMSGALQGADVKEEVLEAVTADDAAEKAGTASKDRVNGIAEEQGQTEGDATTKQSDAPSTNTVAAGHTSASKKTSNGKRKSTGGVPEHKNKKPNKRKSISKPTHLDAQPGEYYFARLKSYPPWPAIICDEGMLPHSLLSTRPVTTKQADGSYREQYADGGKRVHERTFPIMFLHTNEFAWLPNTELSNLDPEDCKDFPEKGKTKSLIQAYHVAAEGHDLEYFKEMLRDHQKAMQEDQDRRDAREAAKAEKSERAEKKKKRKSEVADEHEDVDMDDDDNGEEQQPAKKSSKKRKKEVETDGEDEKPAKTPKTATKLKLTTPKAPETGDKKGKESSKSSKPRTIPTKKKSRNTASDEDDGAEEAGSKPAKPLDPAEAKARKEKEVLFLRHKLQKGFLARDQAPQESEMSAMSNFITKLENYSDLEVSIIRSTKINKVLKALIKLNSIPKDDEFHFKSRSVELLSKWNKALGAEGAADESAAAASGDKEEPPTTNGVHNENADSEGPKKAITSPTAIDAAAAAVATDAMGADEAAAVIDKMVDGDASATAVSEKAETIHEEAEKDNEEAGDAAVSGGA